MTDQSSGKSALAMILNAQRIAREQKLASVKAQTVKESAPLVRSDSNSTSSAPVLIDWDKVMREQSQRAAEVVIASPELIIGATNELGVKEDNDDETWLAEHEDDGIPDILAGVKIHLDPSQEAAVRGLAVQQYGCLIGAAGTGKTTTTRHLLNTLINGDALAGIEPMRIRKIDITKYHAGESLTGDDAIDDEETYIKSQGDKIPTIALVAFTGQATQVLKKNMPPEWRRNCMTIHSCLGYSPVEYEKEDGKMSMRFEPSYNKNNKMPWNVILVDESSMVNINLWHELLDAAPNDCRFYFVGDLNQLPPPIGMGVLGFALAKWPVFELTVVHRQANDAANRIVDTAWSVLQGKMPVLDDPATNKQWRVIGFELKHSAVEAHNQVLALAHALSERHVAPEADPEQPFIYQPWRDRILTPTNGFNESDPSSMLGQFPLNDSLSKLFAKPEEKRVVIDAKKEVKKFAVNYRVMATKNEPPNRTDRVTNGLTGRIVNIEQNPKWLGDRRMVGNEDDVVANRKLLVAEAMSHRTVLDRANEMSLELDKQAGALDNFVFEATEANEEVDRQGGPASHIVDVQFDNGAFRSYNLNAEIEQLQIAYASTTHKAQGAEMPTAIVIVHHSQKRMLCRENLYTAITRASQRVIILYTKYGMQIALANQKVSGSNLTQKVANYQRLLGEDAAGSIRTMNVRLTHRDT